MLNRLGGRKRVIHFLTVVVIVGVVVWIVGDAIFFAYLFGGNHNFSPGLGNWQTWVQILGRVGYDAWLGALALLLLIWLTERLAVGALPPTGRDQEQRTDPSN